jgi:hypothetical protein
MPALMANIVKSLDLSRSNIDDDVVWLRSMIYPDPNDRFGLGPRNFEIAVAKDAVNGHNISPHRQGTVKDQQFRMIRAQVLIRNPKPGRTIGLRPSSNYEG